VTSFSRCPAYELDFLFDARLFLVPAPTYYGHLSPFPRFDRFYGTVPPASPAVPCSPVHFRNFLSHYSQDACGGSWSGATRCAHFLILVPFAPTPGCKLVWMFFPFFSFQPLSFFLPLALEFQSCGVSGRVYLFFLFFPPGSVFSWCIDGRFRPCRVPGCITAGLRKLLVVLASLSLPGPLVSYNS